MGIAIPQVVTEDKAGGAQIIDGGLRFDGGKGQYLSFTPGSAGNRTTWTWSCWIKRNQLGSQQGIFHAGVAGVSDDGLFFLSGDTVNAGTYTVSSQTTSQVLRDISSWYHIVWTWDTNNGTTADRSRIYVNGVRVTAFSSASYPSSGASSPALNNTTLHTIGSHLPNFTGENPYAQISQVYFIDGQALDASYFGYTDPLTNVWRPKKLSSSVAFGTNGFYLPFDGSAPIGQDQSGRGNNWTPVNFGGSNTIEKATGALPILNTDGGGKVARVGVRTDAYASSLSLAIPFIGRSSDLSNQINSGSSTKTTTDSGVTYPTTTTNFYGSSAVYFDSTDTITLSGTWFSDTNFTVEFWAYITDYGDLWTVGGNSCSFYVQSNYISLDGNGVGRVNFTIASGIKIPLNKWTHFAYVKDSSNYYMFIDGVKWTAPIIAAGQNSGTWVLGGTRSDVSDSADWYLQDLRYYSIAKYTSNFIPASTDPDIVPDSPSGVSYSSNVALVPSTDGAVAFDGSSQYLTVPKSTDFDFPSDFTMECLFYLNSLPSTNATFFESIDWNSQLGQYQFGISSSNTIQFYVYDDGNTYYSGTTTLARGVWYHAAVSRSSGTIRLFLNGNLEYSVSNSYSLSNSNQPNAAKIGATKIGSSGAGAVTSYLSGIISNLHIVKGTALYTTNFTPPSAPISSVANTKLLCCKSNSSATAADVTPGTITANGNAAATNFNPFTVNINTQRGKSSGYATLNPLSATATTLSNGNLDFSMTGATNTGIRATTAIPLSGKWYYEVEVISVGELWLGLQPQTVNSGSNSVYYRYDTGGWQNIYINGTQTAAVPGYTNGDIIGCGYDADNQQIRWYKNGIQVGTNYSLTNTGNLIPWIGHGSAAGSASGKANFGQKPFKFPPPAGFQPLTLANTPRPTIVRPDQFVGIVTYTGNGTSQSINVGRKPDLVWIKERNTAENHQLQDTVRGATNRLFSNLTAAESPDSGSLTAFTSNGFTLGNANNYNGLNDTYVAWCWKAGGNSNIFNIDDVGYATASAAGLTAGTITPTGASVNTKSGFSIISFTAQASGSASIPHGLGNTPAFIIVKSRAQTYSWIVYHKNLTSNAYYLILNSTAAQDNTSNAWNSTSPTSSVFTLGSTYAGGGNTVAYLWAEIPGFSKFGSFNGNNSTDGVYVSLGFRPRWLMIKRTDTTSNWIIVDNTRATVPGSNPVNAYLHANLSDVEYNPSNGGPAGGVCDFLSNGFKMREDSVGGNELGTYIYACFAETPTFNLYSAMSNAR